MLFGVNFNHYADAAPYVSGMTVVRTYAALSDAWPAGPDGTYAHWSVRPAYSETVSGALDATWTALAKSAIQHSKLTLWHEPELASGPTPTELAAMYGHVHAIFRAHDSAALLVPVCTTHAATEWWPKGMDAYGVDHYNWGGFQADPTHQLTTWWARLQKAGRSGHTVIAETNTMSPSHISPEPRPAWFAGAYNWLRANGGYSLETFWNPTGPLSGPFLPTDTATIATLNQIAAAAPANAALA